MKNGQAVCFDYINYRPLLSKETVEPRRIRFTKLHSYDVARLPERRGEDVPPWPVFWMRPEGPGSEPKSAEDEVEPVILVNLPQPYPRRVRHAGTTISGGGGSWWGADKARWNDRRLVQTMSAVT